MIDVRRQDEWDSTGVIEGSVKITFFDESGQYDAKAFLDAFSKVVTHKDQPFILVCAHANRTKSIGEFLGLQMGYKHVFELDGGIIDGCPAGLELDIEAIQNELNRRKPGQSKIVTQRKEPDEVRFLSGIFEGKTTGASIGFIIENVHQRSNDYSHIKDSYRPSHADYTYDKKYGVRDYRGGGRSSARETAARVAAGAIAKLMLNPLDISVHSGISEVGGVKSDTFNYETAKESLIYALDSTKEQAQKDVILKAKNENDSVGGVARGLIKGATGG